MPISHNPDRADVNKTEYLQGKITVGTSAVEAKVGATRQENRQTLVIYNNGNFVLYRGHNNSVTTSTGTPIPSRSLVVINTSLPVWLICTNSNPDVLIEEYK